MPADMPVPTDDYVYDWNTETKIATPCTYVEYSDENRICHDNGWIKPDAALLNRSWTAVGDAPYVGWGYKGIYGVNEDVLRAMDIDTLKHHLTLANQNLAIEWNAIIDAYRLPNIDRYDDLMERQRGQEMLLRSNTINQRVPVSGADVLNSIKSSRRGDTNPNVRKWGLWLPHYCRTEGRTIRFISFSYDPSIQGEPPYSFVQGRSFRVLTEDGTLLNLEHGGINRPAAISVPDAEDFQNVLAYDESLYQTVQQLRNRISRVHDAYTAMDEYIALMLANIVGKDDTTFNLDTELWTTYVVKSSLHPSGYFTYATCGRTKKSPIRIRRIRSLTTTLIE